AAESGQLADAEHHIHQATGVGAHLAGGEHFVHAMVSLAAATVLGVRGAGAAAADASGVAVGLARKGAGGLEVAKALLLRAKILEDLSDHEMAAASRHEAGPLLRGSTDAGVAQKLRTAAQRSVGAAVSPRSQKDRIAEDLTAKEHGVLRLLATRLSRREIG